ncbi:MAG: hypothetical protein K6G28_01680 [Acholeplasmatales bacterium]|nr:hypothetical protein [Acholeplasmatales bacterium]
MKGFIMKDFEYVTKKEYLPVKNELIELINLVQDEVRDKFTFRFDFIGSASRNMITRDKKSNTGYDFDVNIRVNDDDNEYSAKEIRRILKDGFDKHSKKFQYDYAEDSKRVLTIKVKDRKNSKILHSCDFAVVNDYTDNQGNDHQEFIYFNKKQNTYEWQEQPEGFYMLDEKIDWIKENGLWQEVRDSYIERKNSNNDPNKKSRSIFAETVAAVFNDNGGYEDDYYDDDEYDD